MCNCIVPFQITCNNPFWDNVGLFRKVKNKGGIEVSVPVLFSRTVMCRLKQIYRSVEEN